MLKPDEEDGTALEKLCEIYVDNHEYIYMCSLHWICTLLNCIH